MAVRYYDDAIVAKLKRWIPDNSALRILKPDETKRLFETRADDTNDSPVKLPMVSLSRSNDIELSLNLKNPKSFDGLHLYSDDNVTLQFNVIPIEIKYQLDIYTKTYEEGDEYLRNFLFKLINNPKIVIDIPYNGWEEAIHHVAYIRVLSTISDTSDITEHLYAGQFTRWTIQFELQNAFLFSIPYKHNWKFELDGLYVGESILSSESSWGASFEKIPNFSAETDKKPKERMINYNSTVQESMVSSTVTNKPIDGISIIKNIK